MLMYGACVLFLYLKKELHMQFLLLTRQLTRPQTIHHISQIRNRTENPFNNDPDNNDGNPAIDDESKSVKMVQQAPEEVIVSGNSEIPQLLPKLLSDSPRMSIS